MHVGYEECVCGSGGSGRGLMANDITQAKHSRFDCDAFVWVNLACIVVCSTGEYAGSLRVEHGLATTNANLSF